MWKVVSSFRIKGSSLWSQALLIHCSILVMRDCSPWQLRDDSCFWVNTRTSHRGHCLRLRKHQMKNQTFSSSAWDQIPVACSQMFYISNVCRLENPVQQNIRILLSNSQNYWLQSNSLQLRVNIINESIIPQFQCELALTKDSEP